MKKMKFSKLSLLSQREQRGLQIDFSSPRTVLVAGNGYGKSAILKSLYETLGAKPHKVDKSWNDARVTSLLEFSVDENKFSALKIGDNFTIYDAKLNTLINTIHVTSELGPRLAEIIDFQLVLADKKDKIRTPPPSYAFAPYYVDQDRSWQKAWDSFKDLAMFSNSARSLSEYHSGLRPNQYYQAKAERDQIIADLAKTDAERRAVDQALQKVRDGMPSIPLIFDLTAFREDTDRLVIESQNLHNEEARYRGELAKLNEELNLWRDHVAVVESAITEVDETFTGSLENPPDVECPMCGQHYQNHIADQFELTADKEDLIIALQSGRSHVREVSDRVATRRLKLDEVRAAIERVQQVLAIHREDISLRDIVAAEGRNEAQRFLQERLAGLDAEYGEKQRRLEICNDKMKENDSRPRKLSIQRLFADKLTSFAMDLDVRLPDSTSASMQGLHIGRGSEGPRALAAYYYAFLHTAYQHGSSAFCPIVIDAPNQQGQDQGHLEKIMEFLLSKKPMVAQVIIAAETVSSSADANIIDISWKKDRVLREDSYTATLEYVRPYLRQSIL